jgi:hypothetical protein
MSQRKYEVVVAFHDIDDGMHFYFVGDAYPRDGYTPAKVRERNLAGTDNVTGRPLIIKIESAHAENNESTQV